MGVLELSVFPMGQVLTLAFLLAVGLYIIFRIRGANRRARDAFRKKQADAEKRREQEHALLERVGRIQGKRDGLEAAKGAVQSDPRRAAKVVSNMMREKK